MRLFVAVVPPQEALAHLEEFLAPRREAGPELRWSLTEHWHLTLAFMPQVAERHLDDVVERLGRAARRRTPMSVSVAGGGAFPNARRAKVLYAGLQTDAHEELRRLAVGARSAASKAGAGAAGGPFHPHLTLARSGRPFEATRWVRVLEGYLGPAWTAGSISLIESRLGQGPRNRPRHDVVETFGLGSAP
jgi:RNA 2',3'-cyclic 3'-phosphodiesterase